MQIERDNGQHAHEFRLNFVEAPQSASNYGDRITGDRITGDRITLTVHSITRRVRMDTRVKPACGDFWKRHSYRATPLTFVPGSVTNSESRSPKGRQPATPVDGARAVPAGGGSSPPFPGGFGKTPGRHDDRSATMSLDWDRKERVTPVETRAIFRTIGIVRPDRVPGSAFWS